MKTSLHLPELGFLVALISALVPSKASAQSVDSVKAVVRTDTVSRAKPAIGRARIAAPGKPPLTPRRAFVYSLILPGLGQSRLDRGSAGAFFAAIELASLAMIQKSSTDLHEARRFSGDSVPGNYTVQTDGKIIGNDVAPSNFPVSLVNTRRLHVEDWFAAIAFNHLLSAADSFVAAQLWDVPASLAVVPRRDGVAVVATLHW